MFDQLSSGRWWDKPWSLVEGCSPVSESCETCWLHSQYHRFGKWPAQARFIIPRLQMPLHRNIPTAYAVWSDLYHSKVLGNELWLSFDVMKACSRHVFLICTKRPERAAQYHRNLYLPDNVAIGTTVENDKHYDRIESLLRVRAQYHFLSIEPMLGPVNIRSYLRGGDGVNWIICGGQAYARAKPMAPAWVRDLRDQCVEAGVPFFFKQWGEYAPCDQFPGMQKPGKVISLDGQPDGMMVRCGKKKAGRTLDGRTWDEIPFPKNND